MTKVWLLTFPDGYEGGMPGVADVYVSREAALRDLYGAQYGEVAARFIWRRIREGMYEGAILGYDGAWSVYGLLHTSVEAPDPDWREYGYEGALPDLDRAPKEWPDDLDIPDWRTI